MTRKQELGNDNALSKVCLLDKIDCAVKESNSIQ